MVFIIIFTVMVAYVIGACVYHKLSPISRIRCDRCNGDYKDEECSERVGLDCGAKFVAHVFSTAAWPIAIASSVIANVIKRRREEDRCN